MVADQPPRPANMERIVRINQGAEPYAFAPPERDEIPPENAERRVEAGAVILDARPFRAFEDGHVPLSFHASGGSPSFEQNAGWILPPDVPVLLAVESASAAKAAVHKLSFVGLDDRVAGWLDVAAWARSGRPVESLARIEVGALEASEMRVLDVRDPSEFAAGHIPGALQVSHKHLLLRLAELPLDREAPIAVACEMGGRSAIACSILRRHGFRNVANVSGGVRAWKEAGLPMETTSG